MAAIPTNWREDEVIVGGLFGQFRSRDVNPVGYDCKMAFWRQELADECHRHQLLLLNRRRLETALVVGIHRPNCLREVFSNLRKTGEMMTEAELRHRCAAARSWTALGAELLLMWPARLLLGWAKRALWAEPEEDVVLLTALKERSDELYARHVSQPAAGELFLVDQLLRLHGALFATRTARTDLELALLELERSGRAALVEVDGRLAAKFRLESESAAPTVTELERGVLRVKLVQSTVAKEVLQLKSDKERLRDSARTLVKNGQKELAKRKLRQWKKMDGSLGQKLNILDNIQETLDAMEDSKDNRKVVDALSRGMTAVRGNLGDVTIDGVNQLGANIQEALEDQHEIASALERPLSPSDASEAAELEAELTDLLSNPATPLPAAQRDRSATSPRIAPSQAPERDRSATLRSVVPPPSVASSWNIPLPDWDSDSDSDSKAVSSGRPEVVPSQASASRKNKAKRKGMAHPVAL